MMYRTFILVGIGFFGAQALAQTQPDTPTAMEAFASEQELLEFLDTLVPELEPDAPWYMSGDIVTIGGGKHPFISGSMTPPSVAGNLDAQTSDFDSAEIVKVLGDYLVILYMGRLFTVNIAGDALMSVDAIDIYIPGFSLRQVQYKAIHVYENKIIVIGHSYRLQQMEVSMFEIDSEGRISHISTYHLRYSNESTLQYFNPVFDSLLIDGKLIFYRAFPLWRRQLRNGELHNLLPAIRRLNLEGEQEEFVPYISAAQIYRPALEMELDLWRWIGLHTITTCDIRTGEMTCEATAALGPPAYTLYFSPTSAYVWIDRTARGLYSAPDNGLMYRLPLDGSSPSALGALGRPIDEFSFLESDDGHLNVLINKPDADSTRSPSEERQRELALLRVPLSVFGNGQHDADTSAYASLPPISRDVLQNRFVGNYLLYGTCCTGFSNLELTVVEWQTASTSLVPLAHSTQRIETIGEDALVMSTVDGELHFSTIRLNQSPSVIARHSIQQAVKNEYSHAGFIYYRPGSNTAGSGLLAVPMEAPDVFSFWEKSINSTSIVFFRYDNLRLTNFGELNAWTSESVNDNCVASCVDWYGETQPIFLHDRIFMLSGYEIVEGRVENGQIQEVQRVNFIPEVPTAKR